MFSNKSMSQEKLKDVETIIGPSIKVKGNFHGKGNIVVEGILEGSLKTNASLLIGEKAKVSANIEAKEAIINGEIKGNIKTRKSLSLGKTARIIGDITCSEISVAKGAYINGHCLMQDEQSKEGPVKTVSTK